jgi:uncharacterized protein YcfJ
MNIRKSTFGAFVALMLLPVAVLADPPNDRPPRGTAGRSIVGGLLGGLVGAQVGSGRGRDAAIVAGALIGSSIARDHANTDDYYRARPQRYDSYARPGYQRAPVSRGYADPGYGHQDRRYQSPSYGNHDYRDRSYQSPRYPDRGYGSHDSQYRGGYGDSGRRPPRGTAGRSIVGGLLGGLVGAQIGGGRGRDAATVAGVLIGSAIGNDHARTDDYYRDRARNGGRYDNGYRAAPRYQPAPRYRAAPSRHHRTR